MLKLSLRVVPYIGTWIETIVAGEDDPEKWSYLI